MRRSSAVINIITSLVAATAGVALGVPAPAAAATTTVTVSMSFTEPIVPAVKSGDCTVIANGFCGQGQVRPLGLAHEMIAFGAGCNGTCDVRTITLPQGVLTLEEFFSNFSCPGICHPSPAEPGGGVLSDIVTGGTGMFTNATGSLTGGVTSAGLESTIKLAGDITFGS